MAVRIITDSSCDMPAGQDKALGVHVMPMLVSFGADEYRDGVDLETPRFYTLLAQAEELPKTAQLNPAEFEAVFRPYAEAGDSIVVLPISRELSGTYNNALIARDAFPDADIHVVDTLNTTFGLAILVAAAARMRDEGLDAAAMAGRLEALRDRVTLYAVIDDLKLLKRGGRLSSAGAVVGTLLGIKPIISVQEGKVLNVDKVRGIRAAYQNIVDSIARTGIDTAYPVYFGHAEFPDALQELTELANLRFDLGESYSSVIGPVVGTHIGFGAVGMAVIARES